MPRKPQLPLAELPRVRRELKQFLEQHGITPTAFARANGVNQSTVQRFLAGDTKTVTPRIAPLLKYAKIKWDMHKKQTMEPATSHPRISQALRHVWDGQEQTAQVLAVLIESVFPVIQQSRSLPGDTNQGAFQ